MARNLTHYDDPSGPPRPDGSLTPAKRGLEPRRRPARPARSYFLQRHRKS